MCYFPVRLKKHIFIRYLSIILSCAHSSSNYAFRVHDCSTFCDYSVIGLL